MKIHFEYIKTTEKVLKHPKYNYIYSIICPYIFHLIPNN